MKLKILGFIALLISITSCNDDSNLPINRKSIYEGEYYNLIKAISDNDTEKMQSLVNSYKLDVNHRDKQYGITLLEWALNNYKKRAFKKLLNMGSDPNFRDSVTKTPVIVEAAGIADIDYLQYCLDYKGNPNITSIVDDKNGNNYSTPLSAAANGRVDNINLLIKYGADVNYAPDGYVPLTSALILNLPAAYALLNHGAEPMKVRLPIVNSLDTLGICQILRNIEEDIPGKDYEVKMAIVKYLKEKYGLDYFTVPIPENVRKNHDTAYLNKY
jgi:ankyrin repeat protein